jgi:LysR family glycine cleavage system transcriptional activator
MPSGEDTVARSLPNLNALRAFEAAARHLSFSLAARELLVTQGAISRQVKALETGLGVALFERRGRAVELTPHGRDYHSVTHDAFELIEAASRRIADSTRRTILTANVLPTFAMRWLIPRLANFAETNPDIEVHMITSIAPVNFNRDDVDVAIRVGTPPSTVEVQHRARIDLKMVEEWKNIRADLVLPDILVPVCSPALVQRTPVNSARDLFALKLLHNATREHAWPDWFAAQDVPYTPGPADQSHGHFFMCLQSAIEGRGVALVPSALVHDDIVAGVLTIPFDRPVKSAGDYYLLCRAPQWNTERVRRFREWLLAQSGLAAAEGLTGAPQRMLPVHT